MHLEETGSQTGSDCIRQAQARDKWRDVVSAVLNLRVPLLVGTRVVVSCLVRGQGHLKGILMTDFFSPFSFPERRLAPKHRVLSRSMKRISQFPCFDPE
jgi:hypothetical protein